MFPFKVNQISDLQILSIKIYFKFRPLTWKKEICVYLGIKTDVFDFILV